MEGFAHGEHDVMFYEPNLAVSRLIHGQPISWCRSVLFERGTVQKGGTCDERIYQSLDRTHDFRSHARVGRGSWWWNVSGNRGDLLHHHRGDPHLRRE